MKNQYIFSFILFICCTTLYAQNAFRYELVGQWNDTTLASQETPFSNTRQVWNDLIGWTHPISQKDFVIIGTIDSIYFFDISIPNQIKKCGAFWGKNRVINRDIEVYKNYAYCVSDNGPDGALQIFDLQYLPDSVVLVKEDTTISKRTHSLFIDSVSKRMYMNSTNSSFWPGRDGMQIFSLDTPTSPKYIGRLTDRNGACGRVHEAYFRNDTAYCSCEYKGLQIFDLRDLDSQKYIGGISPPYPFNGYNHTSWPNDEGTKIVFTDELPYGLPIKLYDIKDKNAPDYITNFNSNSGATPHNVIWIDSLLYTSAYEDGMYVWDMSVPEIPRLFGYYDTHPENPKGVYTGLTGCWGVYPFFKSGIIAASDMKNGLFLLRYNKTVGVSETETNALQATIFPNPFNENIHLSLTIVNAQKTTINVFDIAGKLIYNDIIHLPKGKNEIKLEGLSALQQGMYLMRISNGNAQVQKRIVKY